MEQGVRGEPPDRCWVDGGHFYFESDPDAAVRHPARAGAGRPARRADLRTVAHDERPAFLRGAELRPRRDVELDHTGIENLAELAARFEMAPNAGLWGWGSLRATARDLEDLAVDTGRGHAARRRAWTRRRIDALVLCSNRIPGPAEDHGRFVQRVLTGIGLGDIPCYGQYLNRCVNLLAGPGRGPRAGDQRPVPDRAADHHRQGGRWRRPDVAVRAVQRRRGQLRGQRGADAGPCRDGLLRAAGLRDRSGHRHAGVDQPDQLGPGPGGRPSGCWSRTGSSSATSRRCCTPTCSSRWW